MAFGAPLRRALGDLSNQTMTLGPIPPELAQEFAVRLRADDIVWVAIDGNGVMSLSNPPDDRDILELPWGIFMGGNESETVRHQLFPDDENVVPPPPFKSGRDWDEWIDEASRRMGGIGALTESLRGNDVLRQGVLNAAGGIADDEDRDRALNSNLLRGTDRDEPGRGETAGGREGRDRPEAQRPDGRTASGRDAPGAGGGDRAQGGRDGTGVRPDREGVDGIDGINAADRNYVIAGALGAQRGVKARAESNIRAIECLLEIGDGPATPEQQETLVQYIGWGGIPQIFDEEMEGWSDLRDRLKSLTSDAEYAAMRASTLNAHYTSVPVIQAIWSTLEASGYEGRGDVLEPAAGIGHFIGAGPEGQNVTAVELDPFTAALAAKLYPQSRIENMGFERFEAGVVPQYDLAVGNPPFGSERLYDPIHRDLRSHSVHNHFLAKSIRAVRPGGMAAFVVSRYFLDAADAKTRKLIHEQADLVAATRLPETAFERNAGTNVVADIVVFRKREIGEPVPDIENVDWLHADKHRDESAGANHHLNRMISKDPKAMVIGEQHYDGKMFRGSCYSVRCDDIEVDDQVGLGAELARRLRYQVMGYARNHEGPIFNPKRDPDFDKVLDTGLPTLLELDPNDRQRKMGGLIVHTDGEIYAIKANPDTLRMDRVERVVPKNATADARLRSLLDIRDSVREVLDHEANPHPDVEVMTECRDRMREQVEDFLAKFSGPYNGATNYRLLEDEPDSHLILSLHDSKMAIHAPILTRRVNRAPQILGHPETLQDAVNMSFADRGRLDIDFISEALNRPNAEVEDELVAEQMVYRDVLSEEVVWRDDYLSGNVREKLELAKVAVEDGEERYTVNVTALSEVMPPDIPQEDIYVQVQSPWVPVDMYRDFFAEYAKVDVDCIRYGSNKTFKAAINYSRPMNRNRAIVSTNIRTDYGTDRADAVTILNKLANGSDLSIYDTVDDGDKKRQVLNIEETTKAKIKGEAMSSAFRDWIWNDPDRADRLTEIYNKVLNSHVARAYDGGHMRFDGMATEEVALRKNQKDAAFRMVCSDRTLVDHVVGSGKTYTAIGGEMEKQRMGLIRKSMFVVPNHLVGQWAREYQKLFPGSNVLTMEPGRFTKPNRRAFLAKIATGDWNAVICPHSTFSMINVSKEFQEEMLRDDLAKVVETLNDVRRKKKRDTENEAAWSVSIKNIERAIKRMEKSIRELQDKSQSDDLLTWEQLGFDSLIIDEAQEFKNLRYTSATRNLAGLGPPQGSKKAYDLLSKIRWFDKQNQNERNTVTFLTGTPISNTVAEAYHMMSYLDPDALKERGCDSMDLWLRTFAEITDDFEVTVTGMGFKKKARVRAFHNLPELCVMYQGFADVVTNEDLNKYHKQETGKDWPIPKVRDGEATKVLLEKSDRLEEVFDEICERMKLIEERAVDPTEDNVLKCLHDARTNALDIRIQHDDVKEIDPECKVEAAARSIVRIHDEKEHLNGAQLVFCDLSTPKAFRKEEAQELEKLARLAEQGDVRATDILANRHSDEGQGNYDVYNELRNRVIELSGGKIKADEFAFIHEAGTSISKREKLFDEVRQGKVKVLMGSSMKMGTGMNVQDRLVALHHLDAPWRPSDLEQREGRMLRQGNVLYQEDPDGFEVEIVRYATRATSDPKFWQSLEQKARFIEQFRSGNTGAGTRRMEDIGVVTASYAEMKALSAGNPLILEELTVSNEVRSLESERRSHLAGCRKFSDIASMLEGHQERSVRNIAGIREAVETYKSTPESGGYEDKIITVPTEPEKDELKTDFEARQKDARKAIRSTLMNAMFDEARAHEWRMGKPKIVKYRGLDVEFRGIGRHTFNNGLRNVGVTVTSESGTIVRDEWRYDPRDFSAGGLCQAIDNSVQNRLPDRISLIEERVPQDQESLEHALSKKDEPFSKEELLKRKRERLEAIRLSLAGDAHEQDKNRVVNIKKRSRAA